MQFINVIVVILFSIFWNILLVDIVLGFKSNENYYSKVSTIRSFRHDSSCFTQGLVIHDGKIFESCGLDGQSLVRVSHHFNGSRIMETKLSSRFFAEGLVVVGDFIYVLTWKNKKMVILDARTLKVLKLKNFSTHSVSCFCILLLTKLVISLPCRVKDGVLHLTVNIS